MKIFSVEEQIYICKYAESIGVKECALGLNASVKDIENELKRLKEAGLYEQYKNMSEEDYEAVCKTLKARKRGRPKKNNVIELAQKCGLTKSIGLEHEKIIEQERNDSINITLPLEEYIELQKKVSFLAGMLHKEN